MGRKPVLTRIPNQIQHEEESDESETSDREGEIRDEPPDEGNGSGETGEGNGIDASVKTCPNCRAEVRVDANFCKFCANELEQEADSTAPDDTASPSKRETVLDECPDCGTDLSGIPSDQLSACPVCGTGLSEVAAESDELPIGPKDVDTPPADEMPSDAADAGGGYGVSDRDSDDREDLVMDTHLHQPTPAVIFEVMGREIPVEDGDTIGREVRVAMIEGGAPKDDARYVHRKHARLELVDGKWYLTRLGENSLRVNDEQVVKHERVTLEDGDEVTFSEVVTASVRIKDSGERGGVLPPLSLPPPETEFRGLTAGAGVQRSFDTLINTIPGEVLVLWAAIEGAADLYGFPLWMYLVLLVLAVMATPVYVYRSIDKPDEMSNESIESHIRWWQDANVKWQSFSATGAFLVWVYYLGGPFQVAGFQDPAIAVTLVIIYPVLIVISPYYGSLVLYHVSRLFSG